MDCERKREKKEVNTRAGEGTFPLGLVTMLFFVLFDCGCAENTTVLLKRATKKKRKRKKERERECCR